MSQQPRGKAKGGRDRGGSASRGSSNRGRGAFNNNNNNNNNNAARGQEQSNRGSVLRGATHQKPEQAVYQSKRPAQSNGGAPHRRGKKSMSREVSQEPEAQPFKKLSGQAQKDAGDIHGYYATLKKNREREREHAIANNLVDDPNKQRRLEDAITFVGTCMEMCPEFERVERMVWQAVDGCEKTVGGDGALAPDETKMVKRFRRSAAGDDAQLPSDVRAPPMLKKTLDYLINDIVGGPQPLAKVHAFVWDRTRSIRNDFTLQNIQGSRNPDLVIAIECYEVIARFHIHSLHQLSNPDIDDQGFTAHNEREQLNKTLLTLMELYDLCAHRKLQTANEAEFRAYNILLHMHDQNVEREAMDLARDRRELYEHPRVQKALELYAAAGNVYDLYGPLKPNAPNPIAQNNFGKFFRLARSSQISYTMASCAEIHFNHIRRNALMALRIAYRSPATKEDCTMTFLADILGFDDEVAAQEFCEACGMRVELSRTSETCLVLVSGLEHLHDPNGTLKQPFSRKVVEHKRHARSLPDIIYGLTVRQARAAGKLPEKPAMDKTPSTDPFSGGSTLSPSAPAFQPGEPVGSNATRAFGFGAPSQTSSPSIFSQPPPQQESPFKSSQNSFQARWGAPATKNEAAQSKLSSPLMASQDSKPSPFSFGSPLSTQSPPSQPSTEQTTTQAPKNESLFVGEDSDDEDDGKKETSLKSSSIFAGGKSAGTQQKYPTTTPFSFGSLGQQPSQTSQQPPSASSKLDFGTFGGQASEPSQPSQTPPAFSFGGQSSQPSQPSQAAPPFAFGGSGTQSSQALPQPQSNSPFQSPSPTAPPDLQQNKASPFAPSLFSKQTEPQQSHAPSTSIFGQPSSSAKIPEPLSQTSPPQQTIATEPPQQGEAPFPTPSTEPSPAPALPQTEAQSTQSSSQQPASLAGYKRRSSSPPSAGPRSILKKTRSSSPLRNEIEAPPTIETPQLEEKPKEVPRRLAERVLCGDDGLLENFIDFLIPQIAADAQQEYDEERAVEFRRRKLTERFFYRWKATTEKRGLIRRGRERRERMAVLIQEQRKKKRKSDSSLPADIEPPNAKRLMLEQNPAAARRSHHQRAQTVDGVGKFARSSARSQLATPQKILRPSRSQTSKLSHPSPFLSGNSIVTPSLVGSRTAFSRTDAHDTIKSDYWRLKAAGLHTLPNGVTEPISLGGKKSLKRKQSRLSDAEHPIKSIKARLSQQSPRSSFSSAETSNASPNGINGSAYEPSLSVECADEGVRPRTRFDDEDEELFAEIRQLKEAMDDGIDFYRGELDRDSSRSSSSRAVNEEEGSDRFWSGVVKEIGAGTRPDTGSGRVRSWK